MLEFREALLSTLLSLLRTSLELQQQQLKGQACEDLVKSESCVGESSPAHSDVSEAGKLRSKEEVSFNFFVLRKVKPS